MGGCGDDLCRLKKLGKLPPHVCKNWLTWKVFSWPLMCLMMTTVFPK